MTSTFLARLRSIAAAIDVEGAFIGVGVLGLAFVAWQFDWLLGVVVASVALLGLGVVLAPPDR